MVKKNEEKEEQVQEVAKPSDTDNSADDSAPRCEDLDMKRRKLSRDSTLGSIQEEDSSSIDEKLMIESFKSITDIFENELNEEENREMAEASAVPEEHNRRISDGTDSMDEEVRRIMSKEATVTETFSEVQENTSIKEEDISDTNKSGDNSEDDEKSDSVMTETESDSESDIPFSDSETEDGNQTETSEADRYPTRGYIDEDETELSDEEEFDLEKYIDKLCLQSTDEESDIETEIESDDDSTSSRDTKTTTKKRGSKSRSDDENSQSESNSSDDDTEETEDGTTKGSNSDRESNEDSDDSSYLSSAESNFDYLYDDDDETDSSTTETSQNEDFEGEEREESDPNVSQIYKEDSHTQTKGQPHDAVRKYYLGLEQDNCPVRLDVHESELGKVALDNTLSSGSVVSLRWPYSNYYVKELDLDNDETDSIFDEGLSPTYKSMQSSVSSLGRRRNVLSGRVWWVEWWANSLSDIEGSDRSVEDLQPKDGDDEIPEFGELDNDDISLDESTQL